MTAKPVRHLSQASLFLLELIIATAFLSLSSVVCIRLYLYAHTLSENSALKTQALLQVQNLAGAWQSCDGSLSSALHLYEETAPGALSYENKAKDSPETAELYYDRNGALLSSPEGAFFCIRLSREEQDEQGLSSLSMTAFPVQNGVSLQEGAGSFCSLEVERYDTIP